MSSGIEGRVALVTGGASGMGRSMVQRFLDDGASVVVADLNEEKGHAFLGELQGTAHADRVRFIKTNVANEADVVAATSLAVSAFGQLDIVCNNAGIGGAFGPLQDLDVEDWDETFAVLTRSVFLGTKHAVRQMIAQGWGGSIINTASVAGLGGGSGPVTYSAAKAAVVNFTRSASIELAEHRIRINAICPGAIDTPLLAQGRKTSVHEQKFQPWPEIGRPEDIAGAARFLAGDDSVFMTGQTLVMDGGLIASGPTGWGLIGPSPTGWVGMNRGTTGEKALIRQRPPRV